MAPSLFARVYASARYLVVLMTLAVALSACATGQPGDPRATVRGSGTRATETRDVADFYAINVESGGTLVIMQGDTESFTIEADDNIIPLFASRVEGGVLYIDLDDNSNVQPVTPIVWRIGVRQINAITVLGDVTIEGENVALERLAINVAGRATVNLRGTVDTFAIEVAGNGTVNGEALQTSETSVRIDGRGTIVVAVSDSLSVHIAGEGTVTYIGDPEVTQEILGNGTVRSQR